MDQTRPEDTVNVYSAGKTAAERLLSNLAHTPFVLHGCRYESVEGFWQGLYFPPGSKERVAIAKLRGEAAKDAGRHKPQGIEVVEYRGQTITIGSPEHHELMREAVRAKLEQNPRVLALLLLTYPKEIRHVLPSRFGQPPPDSKSIPGAVFAQILMDLRDEFRRG